MRNFPTLFASHPIFQSSAPSDKFRNISNSNRNNLTLPGPNEQFAVIGSNHILICQANEQIVFWSKDNKNITNTDKR